MEVRYCRGKVLNLYLILYQKRFTRIKKVGIAHQSVDRSDRFSTERLRQRVKIESVLRGLAFMLSDELGMQLHDRETTGEPLTTQEKSQLEAWYAQQDAAETAMLKAAQMPLPNLVFMQDRVDAAISQLTVSVQRLQQITHENKSLREEIEGIKQQLTIPQSA